MPHTYVKPARVTFQSTELMTQVRRGYGFHSYCACGWEGPLRRDHGEAQRDGKAHHYQEHRWSN
jgi:hypothetical protein